MSFSTQVMNPQPSLTMPSSNIEVVIPDDGRQETRYFAFISIAVVVVAGMLLWLNHSGAQTKLSELPNQLSNSATQISNAIAELNMLDEAGLLTYPLTAELLPLPVIPGASLHEFSQTCYVIEQAGYLFAIEKETAWQAHWAKSDLIADCHANLNWHELNH